MTKRQNPHREEEVVILSPSRQNIKINGKLHYNEGAQSWNLIRLKKEVLHEFPQLREKSASFGYTMIISKSKEGFEELIQKEKDGLPILLFFSKNIKEDGKVSSRKI